ncbi:GFA family protein [Litorisediminicola beolgyonensis]|uniref:GFA family protein n=1 Tax=Litorisediminicola beolgyonensis TaxID=1173614 RepID=A0ABW3ZD41_9RHOB
MSERTGQCLCGAVSFTASDVPSRAGICHCEQCRRWTGSALIGVTVPRAGLTWQGAEHIAEHVSSDWAKRGFCARCGSTLFFQFTGGDPKWAEGTEIPVGLFDDPDGFEIKSEIFIDHKPDSYAFAGEGRTVLTRAEVIEKAPQVGGAS